MLNRIEAKLTKLSQAFFYFMLSMFYFILFLPLLRIKIEGKENIPKKGRFIMAANHQNFFDGFLISYILGAHKKVSFVIAKRAVRLKFQQILAKLIGSVLIGNDTEEYQRALKKLNRILTHGGIVGIFPEGNVSKNRIPGKFKGGVAKLSLDSKTRVVPVYLTGTYNLRYFRHFLTRPDILIKIGKPIELYSFAKECGNNLDGMANILRDKIVELIELQEKFENENIFETTKMQIGQSLKANDSNILEVTN